MSAETLAKQANDSVAKCRRILIVDDDLSIRDMLTDVLEIEGFSIYSASNGKEAVELLKSLEPAPCAIVLDMMMPIMNGWQFLDFQRTAPEYSSIPVIICSAYRESAQSVQPHAIVHKPIQLRSLLGAVQSLCA